MENRAMPRAGEFYMHFKGKLYQIVTVAIQRQKNHWWSIRQCMERLRHMQDHLRCS